MACRECGLNIHSDPTCIKGSGNPKAKIMIINSYADDLDEEYRVATMSPQLLEFVDKLGLKKDKIYYTNAIKCRAPKGTKYKVGDLKKCTKLHLEKEIQEVNPDYVMLIGAQATKAVIDGAVTTLSGSVIEKDGRKYLPTLSPGIIYRDPGKAPMVYQAFANFKELITGKTREKPDLNLRIIKNRADIDRAIAYLRENGYINIAYDIESTGLNRFEDNITLFGFGNDKVQYILPLEVKYGPLRGKKLAQKKLMQYLIKKLNTHTKRRIAGNGKFDNLFVEEHFGVRPSITFDVVLASHILNENTSNGVKDNAIRECNAIPWDINLNLKKGNVQTKDEYDEYLEYLGYDIYYEYQLYKVFSKRIKADKSIYNLYYHLYMPGILAYEDVEKRGVYIFPKQFKQVRRYLGGQLADIEKKLSKYGKDINWGSSAQVRKLLYEDLELPVLETTESGEPSTSEATLQRIKDKHPVVDLILQHRGVAIQVSHFVDGWINRMHNGRLYPKFKLHGTVTGRTSCTDPNLQQVPRDPKIRGLVGAPKGRSFIEIDFSQAELRIATIMSGDPAMADIYINGGDIHSTTYEIVSGEKVSDDKYIRKEQRKKAKAVNFGFLYGMGWKKFKDYARDTYGVDLTEEEAQEYRERFFSVYCKLPEWHDRQRRIVRANGEVRSPIGRLRRLPDIYSTDKGKKAEAERQSINSPVQGFGSDLTILGLAEIMGYSKYSNKELKLDRSRFDVVGTVHDATLFEVDDDYLIEFLPKARQIMQKPKALSKVFKFESPIPIIADATVGLSWGGGMELDLDNPEWVNKVEEYLSSK